MPRAIISLNSHTNILDAATRTDPSTKDISKLTHNSKYWANWGYTRLFVFSFYWKSFSKKSRLVLWYSSGLYVLKVSCFRKTLIKVKCFFKVNTVLKFWIKLWKCLKKMSRKWKWVSLLQQNKKIKLLCLHIYVVFLNLSNYSTLNEFRSIILIQFVTDVLHDCRKTALAWTLIQTSLMLPHAQIPALKIFQNWLITVNIEQI